MLFLGYIVKRDEMDHEKVKGVTAKPPNLEKLQWQFFIDLSIRNFSSAAAFLKVHVKG